MERQWFGFEVKEYASYTFYRPSDPSRTPTNHGYSLNFDMQFTRYIQQGLLSRLAVSFCTPAKKARVPEYTHLEYDAISSNKSRRWIICGMSPRLAELFSTSFLRPLVQNFLK